jgi:DUF1365 family protein
VSQSGTTVFSSVIGYGTVRHRRFWPKSRHFLHKVVYAGIDLDEVDRLPWPTLPKALGWIGWRRDTLFCPEVPSLDQAVRQAYHAKTGKNYTGKIRWIGQLAYWGFGFNPVSFYVGENFLMAEITNTPWSERHCYWIFSDAGTPVETGTPEGTASPHRLQGGFKKDFHDYKYEAIENRKIYWYSLKIIKPFL